MHVLSVAGELLGSLEPLDVSSGSSISTQGEVWSTCLHWNGAYKDTLGRPRALEVGSSYKLRAFMQGPVAVGDLGRNVQPGKAQVGVRPAACTDSVRTSEASAHVHTVAHLHAPLLQVDIGGSFKVAE